MPTFSSKERKTYQNICHLSERGVLSLMRDVLSARYDKVTATPSFVYALGDIPVALVAHADTVFRIPPAIENFFYDPVKDVLWNPDGAGADDRAGIFAILQLVRKYRFKPHVIITTGEESGCIGAGKLIAHMPQFPADLKFMIQLDRRNHEDAVYYDCDNPDFEEFITKFGFKTEWGTLSDISLLAPTWKVAAVNLSVGYEDEHHEIERLHVNWLCETIEKVAQILNFVQSKPDEVPFFQYIPAVYGYAYGGYGCGGYYGSAWYDYDDDYSLPEGYDHCFMCNHIERKENMIPVWYPHGLRSYNMCLRCHSDVSNQVVWCKECNRGFYLTKEQAKKIPNLNDWTCEECANGKHKGNSESIQQSAGVQPGLLTGGKHGSDFHGMENEQRLVHVREQLANLGMASASNL